ncbi:hypothetical protein TNIN_152861 [Trichonephila inaurata madagascariensis]|uniref:Uncharacterized protein n=1 Tax=Trichonephila inaurata madagascariensis TaxID=2747483 RepID=A0A8X6XIC3_9ARAC|nr:hypothetical protein TNIN_152861 [Trichonephila inaurata madagascariensis]
MPDFTRYIFRPHRLLVPSPSVLTASLSSNFLSFKALCLYWSIVLALFSNYLINYFALFWNNVICESREKIRQRATKFYDTEYPIIQQQYHSADIFKYTSSF